MKNKFVKIIVIILTIILALAIVLAIVKTKNQKLNLVNIEEKDVTYFLLEKEGKFGVIDREGNTVIEPKYAKIDIPNPTKDVFICLEDIEKTNYKALNSKGETLFSNYDSVSAIMLNELSSYVPYEKTVLVYKEAGKYGIMDFTGKKITDANFEKISGVEYKEGFLKVKKNGEYGVINILGKTVIPANYDDIKSDGYYSESAKYSASGFILRTKTDSGYKYGYANNVGNILIESMYDALERVNEIEDEKNIYLIYSNKGKMGVLENKKELFSQTYDEIEYDSSSKMFIVNDEEKYGVFNMEGKEVLPVEYDSISFGGDYINTEKDGEKKIFDLTGNVVNTEFISHKKVNDNYSIVIDSSGKYNIVDSSNKKLLAEDYIYIDEFANNLFIATNDNSTGIIDGSGKVVVNFEYSSIQKINDTELLQAISNDKTTNIILPNGKVQKGLENASIDKEANYIKMYTENDVKYFDLSGNETTYQNLVPNQSLYASKKDGKWGFVNAAGETVVNYEYSMVTEFSNGFAGICKDGKWGVINEKGEVVQEPIYEKNLVNRKFILKYYEIPNNVGVSAFSED